MLLCCRSAWTNLWLRRRLEKAIYQHAGVSSAGFAVAGTSLNQPLEAELFELDTGNQSLLRAADTNPQDHDTVFAVDIAQDSTTTVALQSARGNFTSIVYKWDACPDPPLCTPRADWEQVVNKSEITQVKVSADGTVIALLGAGNMSYYEPPNIAIWVYDGATGREREEGMWTGEVGEEPGELGLSNDGKYIAFTSSIITGSGRNVKVQEFAHVIELSSGKKHRHEITAWGSNDPTQSDRHVAISTDGQFLACGSANVIFVWKRTGKGEDMTYTEHTTLQISMEANAFFLGASASLAFGGEHVLGAAWINVPHPRNGVAVTAWKLLEESGTPARLLLNYSLPTDDNNGDSFQNTPSGVSVSSSGSYLALCSWGTEEKMPGQEQLQLFSLDDDGPVVAPSIVCCQLQP